MKDMTQIERGKTISFFNELDIETRTMLVTFVSFFNEVASEMQKISSAVVSFFNEIEIKKPCSKTSISFFNEVASETQKLSSKPLFHFLTRLLQRRKNYP
jgi:preprotein translocase subunit SecE